MRSPVPPRPAPETKRYVISFSTQAAKQFKKLPAAIAQRLKTEIAALADDPRPHGYIKLRGQEAYRIRVGDYRIMYSIFDDQLLVEIVKVGQRSNFYDE